MKNCANTYVNNEYPNQVSFKGENYQESGLKRKTANEQNYAATKLFAEEKSVKT